MTWEIDTEPYAVTRDAQIQKLAEANDVLVETFTSHTLRAKVLSRDYTKVRG